MDYKRYSYLDWEKTKAIQNTFFCPNSLERDIYKKYSNVLARVKTASKKTYFHKAIHDRKKNSPKKIWEVLRQLLGGDKKSLDLPSVMNIDEKRVEEPELIAESFNDFFGDLGRRLVQNINEPNINFKYFLHKSNKLHLLLRWCHPPPMKFLMNWVV